MRRRLVIALALVASTAGLVACGSEEISTKVAQDNPQVRSGAKLFAGGSVSLGGRLDLDVVYNTGNIGPSAPLLRLFLRDIPAIGPIPVGLIVRVTEALSNRIVRLRVEGTTDRPNVRVNAANLLSENAVRFFVGQYVPLSSPTK